MSSGFFWPDPESIAKLAWRQLRACRCERAGLDRTMGWMQFTTPFEARWPGHARRAHPIIPRPGQGVAVPCASWLVRAATAEAA